MQKGHNWKKSGKLEELFNEYKILAQAEKIVQKFITFKDKPATLKYMDSFNKLDE